jgi:hypothetical protein
MSIMTQEESWLKAQTQFDALKNSGPGKWEGCGSASRIGNLCED